MKFSRPDLDDYPEVYHADIEILKSGSLVFKHNGVIVFIDKSEVRAFYTLLQHTIGREKDPARVNSPRMQ